MKVIKGQVYERVYTDDYTFDVRFYDVETSEGNHLTDILEDYENVTVIIDKDDKVRKLLQHAKTYVQGRIASIEMDLASGLYGENAMLRLEDKLVDYLDELHDIETLIGGR
jgi:phage head maturation protease